MAIPDDSDERTLDEIELAIRRELDRIELDLSAVLDGLVGSDPEPVLDRLERTIGSIEGSLGELAAKLGRLGAAAPIDLNQIAQRILQDVLVDVEKPLVLRVTWSEGLPQPIVSSEPLRSLLTRLLTLVARFATAGDAVLVSTRREDDGAVLRVEIEPADRRTARDVLQQLRLRAVTLGEFVTDLGGRLAIGDDPDQVALELCLPLAMPRR